MIPFYSDTDSHRIVQNAYVLNIPPTNPIEIYQKAGIMSWCVWVFNSMKDLDTKDTDTRKFLNSLKKKLSYCPDTSHEWAAWLIRKCVKKFWRINILDLAKPGTYITFAQKVSEHTKFEGCNLKIDFRNAKNAKVTWSAIMHIFNEIWCSYSIPSKILIQMTYISYIIEIHWKQLKLSSGHLKSTENN